MSENKTYKISGVPVLFPGKPYPSQFCMMDRIIKGIERRQHCLLESPTGSGKSLALLCSALAWLSEEKEPKKTQYPRHSADHSLSLVKGGWMKACVLAKKNQEDQEEVDKDEAIVIKDDDEDDFKKDGLNFNTKSSDKKNPKKHISIAYESDESKSMNGSGSPDCKQCSCSSNTKSPVNRKIPKIFFGTRTHKQVSQIVRELGKTEYRDVNMTILGSREHTCIHPVVSKTKSKIEGCKELMNGPGCPLKDRAQRYMSHQVIKGQGLSSAWDLEDLVSFSKPKKICPYFLSRGLKEEADLIICPYNYLVDPLIREAMMLSLKGHVVILDEAHNIEDSAREAASQTIPQENITAAIKDIEELMQSNNLAEYSRLVFVLKKLDDFIEEHKNSLEQKEFNQSYKIWSGFHIVAQLEGMGMGPKHFPDLKKAQVQIKMDAEERKEDSMKKGLSEIAEMQTVTLTVIEQLFMVMDFLYRLDLKYADDYRACLIHSINYVSRSEESQWLNSRNRNGGRRMVQVDVINLNFWCMNPAVAFSDFVDTRSVILTSGTLSPMTSFQSELGLDFKIQLEANHIIKDSQVWVGSLGQGPNGTGLMAVYRNLESFTFQDELGQVVLQVCKTVPHGVLCFLPSYKVLDKLYTRWESTGLLDKLGERKKVLREPRGSNKEEFEEEILSYYRAVENTNDPDSSTDGAVMFAVCRGKISEGLDFADAFARAVISVGIPYPNFKDIQVELKRKYNDQHRAARGLMSGSDWYDIQAFRALNQALGRCIRHRNDWGALIVIDERFVKNAQKYTKGLSKWVRNKMCTHDNYTRGMESLKEFISFRKKEEKEQLNTLECPSMTPVTAKPADSHTSLSTATNSNGGCCKVPDNEDNNTNAKGFKAFTPKTESPALRQYSIFSMSKSHPKSSKKYPKLSSISTPPSSKNIPPSSDASSLRLSNANSRSSHQHLPTTVVHPSFVLPPKSSINLPPKPQNGNNTTTTGNHIQNSSTITSSEQIPNQRTTNDKPKTSLRIITAVVPPGTRTQVFEIDPALHHIYGGNLNLPVSSTERLVYIVEPPRTPGGNPLARLMKMSKEEKEKLSKTDGQFIHQQQQTTKMMKEKEQSGKKIHSSTISDNLPLEAAAPISMNTNQSPSIPPHNASLHSNNIDRLQSDCQNESSKIVKCDKNLKESTLSNTSNLRLCHNAEATKKSCVNNEGTLNSMEEESNSSCSLFDSPAAVPLKFNTKLPVKDSLTTSCNGQSVDINGKTTPSTDSTSTESSKKNPLLKFFTSSDNASKTDSTNASKTSSKSSSENNGKQISNNSSTSETSPDMFQSRETPVGNDVDSDKDLETVKIRKPLFKNNSRNSSSKNPKHNDEESDLFSPDTKRDNVGSATAAKTSNIRRSAPRSLESSPMNSKMGEEEELEISLKVKRKCGRKRSRLSITARSDDDDNKKCKSDAD